MTNLKSNWVLIETQLLNLDFSSISDIRLVPETNPNSNFKRLYLIFTYDPNYDRNVNSNAEYVNQIYTFS